MSREPTALPRVSASPRALPDVDTRIPLPLSTLVGRTHDIAAIVALVADSHVRLVTLTGPGGVGKTRIALQVARVADTQFAAGAVFVSLGAILDHDLVIPAIAQAVGMPPGATPTLVASLVDPDTGARASLENAPVTIVAPAADAVPDTVPTQIPPPQVVTIGSATITPNADPIQYANVSLVLVNAGPYPPHARVTLLVSHDGVPVEELVLDDNLPLPVGETTLETRYIPPAGFDSGAWTFGLVVHAINADATVETRLLTVPEVAAITVP